MNASSTRAQPAAEVAKAAEVEVSGVPAAKVVEAAEVEVSAVVSEPARAGVVPVALVALGVVLGLLELGVVLAPGVLELSVLPVELVTAVVLAIEVPVSPASPAAVPAPEPFQTLPSRVMVST